MGDTSTPAEPQFAILELGQGYGGMAEWTWKIPSLSSAEEIGLADGMGLFGHSVALLPGDVLMIAGGYSIPKKVSKRETSSMQPNTRIYLYNVTSSSWVKSYSDPSISNSAKSPTLSSSEAHDGGLSTGQKAGLGVGLGVGIPLVVLIAICLGKYDRKRRVRDKR